MCRSGSCSGCSRSTLPRDLPWGLAAGLVAVLAASVAMAMAAGLGLGNMVGFALACHSYSEPYGDVPRALPWRSLWASSWQLFLGMSWQISIAATTCYGMAVVLQVRGMPWALACHAVVCREAIARPRAFQSRLAPWVERMRYTTCRTPDRRGRAQPCLHHYSEAGFTAIKPALLKS